MKELNMNTNNVSLTGVVRSLCVSVAVAFALSGCAVVAVADAAASLAIGAVKTTAKVAGAVVDAAIPDGKKD
jgi:hypothetical protein